MIKQEARWFIYAFGEIICVILSIFTWNFLLMPPINAFLLFGSIFIVFMIVVDLWFENWKWRTEQVIFNIVSEKILGHCSIRLRDVFHIPWDIELNVDGTEIKSSTQMTVMLTGGTDYSFYSGMGSSEFPVLIFPSIYEERKGNNCICHANLAPYTIDQLDLSLQEQLLNLFPKRITRPKKIFKWEFGGTPIYFGLTAKMDGTATSANIALEEKMKIKNETIKVLTDELNSVREQLKKREELNRNDVMIARQSVDRHD